VQFIAGQGMDVQPHPHIGLATVSYLFDGKIMHRDSGGNIGDHAGGYGPDDGGARHRPPNAPRTRPAVSARACSGFKLDRAAAGRREIIPSFQHFDAANLPVVEDRGMSPVIAGSAFGRTSRSACCRNGSMPKWC
jgi:redox-sensitive bicupin YhaK (pirin superfamily)